MTPLIQPTISTAHTGCKLISFIKENKGMVAMMLVLCPSKSPGHTYMGPLFEFYRRGSFSTASRRHFRSQRKCPLSSVSFRWGVRGTSSTKSIVTECVKRAMVVYTRSFDFFYVLICCFTSTVSSWCHVGTVTYLTTLFLGNSPVGSSLVSSDHSFGQ